MNKILAAHRAIVATCATAFVFVLGGFIWAISALGSEGAGPFILHFNDISGITQTGGIAAIAFAGLFAVIAAVINFVVAVELDARNPVLGKIVAVLTLVAAVLLFIGCAAIINVNV